MSFLLIWLDFRFCIEILAGINQIHSSCKDWINDPTTQTCDVSYAYALAPHENNYDIISVNLVKK
ncbi:hypothetical protein [uncultured Catenibacterium sp.]|uniref:hypothetical protein n=1 Tax=uncultured Catenibacterium sp. TaxID=286142 RepID=UPI00258E3F1E|nr:hypothetical protein [uncultured Catenibacterium sp.]